jgi:hypothetical protein
MRWCPWISGDRYGSGWSNVLVGANTGSLESLGGKLLVLVGNQVDAHGEVIHVGLLTTKIEDTNLRVGNTTVEPGLGVGLEVDSCQSNRSWRKNIDPPKIHSHMSNSFPLQ